MENITINTDGGKAELNEAGNDITHNYCGKEIDLKLLIDLIKELEPNKEQIVTEKINETIENPKLLEKTLNFIADISKGVLVKWIVLTLIK